jgi:hypothetical protein
MKAAYKAMDVFLLLLVVSWSASGFAGEAKKSIIVSDIGLSTPESVEYNGAEDVYLVTNINGDPLAADGNGFISKLGPDGSVIDLKWIDGTRKGVTLNAPKGAAIADGKLFVADLNQVQVFALPSGKQIKSITIAGSTFLNGITPGSGDSVYVTDSGFKTGFAPSGTDAIYRVWANGKYTAIAKDKEMGHPNGIWNNNGRLVVVTYGSGEMFSVDPSGKRTAMPSPPKGALDGLIRIKDGPYLVSSWEGSAIYSLDDKGNFSVLADSLESPADLGFDTRRSRVLIPLFKLNKVVILPY